MLLSSPCSQIPGGDTSFDKDAGHTDTPHQQSALGCGMAGADPRTFARGIREGVVG